MTKNIIAASIDVVFQSAKDAAYSQAVASDGKESAIAKVAGYVKMHNPQWPTTTDAELESELTEGYRLRFAENNPPVVYGYVEGQFVNVTQLAKKPKETSNITVQYCVGLSNYDLRKIEDKDKKAVVQAIRNQCSNYVANRMSDLKKAILGKGERKRNGNKTLHEFWTATFDVDSKIIHAKTLGDPLADLDLHKKAYAAFWQVFKDAKMIK
jgi:hypothetical protein